ncbi:unnamed protein product [Symbiodinium natans]|uniref:Uncharacterized protein n=1 Tax=Symbiodinium natans TaxID=878477 RepID=A0A812K041_9DINO|nr:unnamed protein product [Symbiodinium natans]
MRGHTLFLFKCLASFRPPRRYGARLQREHCARQLLHDGHVGKRGVLEFVMPQLSSHFHFHEEFSDSLSVACQGFHSTCYLAWQPATSACNSNMPMGLACGIL